MEKSKNQFYPITIKGNYAGLGSEVIKNLAETNGIDLNLYYVDTIKVKQGNWNTSAKKRDQDLTWVRGKGKHGVDNSIMEGHSKHFPEFMMATNKTNYIEVTFKRKPIEVDILATKSIPCCRLSVL